MSIIDFLRQDRWRGELIVNGTSFGYWDRDEINWGSETSDVIDPEFGAQPNGGRQTADTFGISRPWQPQRDRPVYQTLKPLRGRNRAQFVIHELDPSGQPFSSQPLETLDAILTEIKIPEASAGGSDTSVISATLQVRP